ncbi:MAG: 30S ribosomal protein S19e [archaeon]
MANTKDVNAHDLINAVAKDLKDNKNVKMPEFAFYVKTGSSRERAPQNPDWWYIRMASILRKVYVNGKVTVSSLKTYYGGKKNRGSKPERFKKAGGKIIRVILQDLEKLSFVKKSPEKKGRILTKEGQSYLDKFSKNLLRNKKTIKKEVVNEAIVIKEKKIAKVVTTDAPKEHAIKKEAKN